MDNPSPAIIAGEGLSYFAALIRRRLHHPRPHHRSSTKAPRKLFRGRNQQSPRPYSTPQPSLEQFPQSQLQQEQYPRSQRQQVQQHPQQRSAEEYLHQN